MIPGLPNPWLILGAVLFALVAMTGAFFYGGHVESLAWEKSVADMKAKAALELADALRQVSEANIKNQALTDQLEKDNDDKQKSLDRALAAMRRDLHASSLFVKPGRGPSGEGAVRDASGSAPISPGTPAACRISNEDADTLLEMAGDAERNALFAATGQHYAKAMTAWLKAQQAKTPK